jgi:hypothetical protein
VKKVNDEPQFDVAFDWDGTLTSGDGPVGQDNGQKLNLLPLELIRAKGYAVAIMTCNEAGYVAQVLQRAGIPARADMQMEHKIPPQDLGQQVVVTQRKVLSRFYVDDRNIEWRYGDNPQRILDRLAGKDDILVIGSRYTGDRNVSVTDPSTWAPWR